MHCPRLCDWLLRLCCCLCPLCKLRLIGLNAAMAAEQLMHMTRMCIIVAGIHGFTAHVLQVVWDATANLVLVLKTVPHICHF